MAVLIEANADVDRKNKGGSTALIIAGWKGPAYVITLRNGGAPLRVLALDLNRVGARGTRALAWAVGANLLRSLEE